MTTFGKELGLQWPRNNFRMNFIIGEFKKLNSPKRAIPYRQKLQKLPLKSRLQQLPKESFSNKDHPRRFNRDL